MSGLDSKKFSLSLETGLGRYSRDEIDQIKALIDEGLSNREIASNWDDLKLESETSDTDTD